MKEEPKQRQRPVDYDWLELPDHDTVAAGWAHHGVAVTETGRIVAFDAAGDQVRVFSAEGDLVSRWSSGLTEGHAITTVVDDGECVWIADPGQKMAPTGTGGYKPITAGAHGRVVKFTLDGQLARELPMPPMPIYEHHRYSPSMPRRQGEAGASGSRTVTARTWSMSLQRMANTSGRCRGTSTVPMGCCWTAGARSQSCTSPTGKTDDCRCTASTTSSAARWVKGC